MHLSLINIKINSEDVWVVNRRFVGRTILVDTTGFISTLRPSNHQPSAVHLEVFCQELRYTANEYKQP